MVRLASDSLRAKSNRSPMCRAALSSSPYWASSWSSPRPDTRCSSVRTSSNVRCASSSEPPGDSGRAMPCRSISCATPSASSSCTSRRPPRPDFRSGSARCAIRPHRSQRAWVISTSSSIRERIALRHWRLAPAINSSLNRASPATCRASSMPSAAIMSPLATPSAPDTVRTLWSSRTLASHNGYHSASATRCSTSSDLLSCNSIRSRSEYGSSSWRPRPPMPTRAKPLSSAIPIWAALAANHDSCRSSQACRSSAACSLPPSERS